MRFLSTNRLACQWVSALWLLTGFVLPAVADYPLVTNSVPALADLRTNAASEPLVPSDTSEGSPHGVRLSPWLAEFLKLAQAGLEEEVLFSFVSNTEGTFNLTADQIVWLRDLGISGGLINALLEHDRELASGLRELKGASVPGDGGFLPVLARAGPASRSVGAGQPVSPESGSIIVPDHTPEGYSLAQVVSEDPEPLFHSGRGEACGGEPRFWRVRKPHAVRLTDPILVFRSAPRIPNILIIQPLR